MVRYAGQITTVSPAGAKESAARCSRSGFLSDLRMSPGSCYEVADASPFTAHVQSTTPVAKLAAEVRARDRETGLPAPNRRAVKPLIEPCASSPFSALAGRAAA